MKKISYPTQLEALCHTLIDADIRPIIVGGYIRDFFLQQPSKDIDIELYGVATLDEVIPHLQPYGNLNCVGKSFGVLKLTCKDFEIDFSLPRKDSKIAQGHKGFEITTDVTLTFKEAAKRRDFTINAMGYDIEKEKFLDPYNGKKDLDAHILKAVDIYSFAEDPLRVLRIMQFCGRFELTLDTKLQDIAQTMITQGVLFQLPKERIFLEFEKLFIKAKKISYGIEILRKIKGFVYFQELSLLKKQHYYHILNALDTLNDFSIHKDKKIILSLALLCIYFTKEQTQKFLERFTQNKQILKEVQTLLWLEFSFQNLNNYTLYKLATQIDIEFYSYFLYAKSLRAHKKEIQILLKKAQELGVLHTPSPPLIKGQDLINEGLQPSQKFSSILNTCYEAQMKELFTTKEEALIWLHNHLISK